MDKKTELIAIKLTPEQREHIKKKAKEDDRSEAYIIRQLIDKDMQRKNDE